MKMMEAFQAEKTNPTLYNEMQKEFRECFDIADGNKNGVLDEAEFKTFMQFMCANMKQRFGENERGDNNEEALWFAAYQRMTPERDGISLADFKGAEKLIEYVVE